MWESRTFFYDTMIRLGSIIIIGEELVEDPEFHRLAMGFVRSADDSE